MPPSSPGSRPGAPARPFLKTARSPQSARSGPLEAREGESALKALLADLGSQIRRGRGLAREVAEPLRFCPTGIPRLDALLGGGFPRGRLSELCGAPSSGRTSLAMTLLAETLARGTLAAWVDSADAFDPASAAAALAARSGGLEEGRDEERDESGAGRDGDGSGSAALRRLLWVRARTEKEAIRCCERILATEGFELILFDLAHTPTRARSGGPRAPAAIPDAGWLRLARLAARHRSALVVLSNTARAGSRAELVLEMRRARARFSGPPALLDALETTAVLRRHRTRPTGQEVPLSLAVDPSLHTAPNPGPSLHTAPNPGPTPHADPQRLVE